jgi:PHD/YefM family antitoxin component YafN of YafNO toxin-antitoxin module
MPITTISDREFSQDVAGAKRATEHGPVVITDRGEPAFVLQRYEDWRRQAGVSLLDALADPDPAAFDVEPPRAEIRLLAADLS